MIDWAWKLDRMRWDGVAYYGYEFVEHDCKVCAASLAGLNWLAGLDSAVYIMMMRCCGSGKLPGAENEIDVESLNHKFSALWHFG